MAKIAVLLTNLGGPTSLDDVEPFLYNIFKDSEIIKLPMQRLTARIISKYRANKTRKKYEKIGGKSPLNDITQRQAEALGRELGEDFYVSFGMRYWHPTIEESLKGITREKPEKIVVLPLFPQYSRVTTGTCITEVKRVLGQTNYELKVIESWYDHPAYLDALSKKIRDCLSEFKNEVHIIFSAHAVPKKIIDSGDPYVEHVKATVDGLISQLGNIEWHIGYQSQAGPIRWTEPKTEDILHDLAKKNVKNVLIVPVSFVSDHLETLYDIDIHLKNIAEDMDITLKRVPSLNDSPDFISALEQIIREALQ
jgi:ferrochelatase